MPRGYRCIVVAVLGWLALSSPSEAQKANSNQSAPQSASESKLDRIAAAVEKLPKAQTPDGGCEPGKDDRYSDLCAQWKAADAAAESADWTARAFWTGLVGLIVGGGTLFFAGWAAHWAKEAARHTEAGAIEAKRAADAAEQADRPHLLLTEMTLSLKEPDLEGKYPLSYSFTNHGRGPAWLQRWGALVITSAAECPEFDISGIKYAPARWSVAPDGGWMTVKPLPVNLGDVDVPKVLSGGETLFIYWTVDYIGSDHRPHTNSFVLKYVIESERLVPIEHPLWQYS